MAKKYWLMKTEPNVFSFNDLTKAPNKTTCWEGVRNYQARNFMRDDFKVGDQVLIYHSNTEVPGVMGIAEVVKAGYPDEHAMDPKSNYFDPDAAKKGVNPWIMVDVKAVRPFKKIVSLETMKASKDLKTMMVTQKGSRLSVQPVTEREFQIVCQLGLYY